MYTIFTNDEKAGKVGLELLAIMFTQNSLPYNSEIEVAGVRIPTQQIDDSVEVRTKEIREYFGLSWLGQDMTSFITQIEILRVAYDTDPVILAFDKLINALGRKVQRMITENDREISRLQDQITDLQESHYSNEG